MTQRSNLNGFSRRAVFGGLGLAATSAIASTSEAESAAPVATLTSVSTPTDLVVLTTAGKVRG